MSRNPNLRGHFNLFQAGDICPTRTSQMSVVPPSTVISLGVGAQMFSFRIPDPLKPWIDWSFEVGVLTILLDEM